MTKSHENHPEEPYVAWHDTDLQARSKGDVNYFICLVEVAQAQADFEEAAQAGIDDATYRDHQAYIQELKNKLTSYEIKHGYASTPEDEPPS